MGVIKVSNSESDLQGHSRSSVEISLGHPNLKWAMRPWPCPIYWWCVILMLGIDIEYMHAKFDHSSFSGSRDMVGAHRNLNVSHDLTTPLSGTVCHPWASTCYDKLIYQTGSLYLYPLQIYERKYKIAKMGWFSVVTFSHVGTVLACDRWTDRWTDRRTNTWGQHILR